MKNREIIERLQKQLKKDGVWYFEYVLSNICSKIKTKSFSNLQKKTLKICSKRADAVIKTPDELYVCEATEKLSMRAIGQVLSYAVLIKNHEIAKNRKIKKLIACCQIDKSLSPVCSAYDIEVIKIK